MVRLNNVRVHEVVKMGVFTYQGRREVIMRGRNYLNNKCVYYYKKTGRVNNTYLTLVEFMDWRLVEDL